MLELLDGLHRPEIWTQAKSQGYSSRAVDHETHRGLATVPVSQGFFFPANRRPRLTLRNHFALLLPSMSPSQSVARSGLIQALMTVA